MDLNEGYETHEPPQQIQNEQQQQMQCDPTNGEQQFDPTDGTHMPLELPMQTAIPLPAPSTYDDAPCKMQTQASQPNATDLEIDSCKLLQQFSCLGTTDHEDLISQFQSLMNNKINIDSARFFLEMNNWNLQTAVGCYLDYCNFQTLPSMKIVEQVRPNDYQQRWRIQNDGTENWPLGCYLMSPSQTRRVEIPRIKPGDTCDIVADIPPSQPAIMWRLCTPNGWYFGETIWMIPPGTCDTQTDLVNRMSQLRTSSNSTNPESFPQVNIVISVNME